MTPVRRLWLLLFFAVFVFAGIHFWPFDTLSSKSGQGTGLKETRWGESSAPTFKEKEIPIPYDAEKETAAAAAEAEMAAKELEKDAAVPDHLLALGDETLSDEQVRGRLRRAILKTDLSLEDRAEALDHLHNLTAGRSSEQLLPLARDPALAPDLLAEMLDESLNRDFFYQADLALSVLEKRQEPELIEAARRQLSFLAGGADHGLNVAQWRAALAQVSAGWVSESVSTEK